MKDVHASRHLTAVTIRSLLVALGGALAIACGSSKIQSFDAEPSRICAGDTVEVHWQVAGEARLTTEPELPVSGTVAAADTFRLALDTTTTFELVPVGSRRKPDRQEVVVYSGGEEGFVALPRTGMEGDSIVIGRDSTEAGAWEDLVRVTYTSNPREWPVTVEHAGREAIIPPDSSSDAFRGTARAGTWQMRAPVTGGDPPDNLVVAVGLQCNPGGN